MSAQPSGLDPDGRTVRPALVPCPGDDGAIVRGEAFEVGADDAGAAILLAAHPCDRPTDGLRPVTGDRWA